MTKQITYRDLQRWLRSLNEAQLNAPVLVTPGADDFGGTEYLPIVALVDVANEHPTISGGYQGPVLLITPQMSAPPERPVGIDPAAPED